MEQLALVRLHPGGQPECSERTGGAFSLEVNIAILAEAQISSMTSGVSSRILMQPWTTPVQGPWDESGRHTEDQRTGRNWTVLC